VHKGQVLLDPRTLLDGEEPLLLEAIVQALAQPRVVSAEK
jgi:hypothetical protein